jgi:lambda family phage portal protein
MFDRLRRFMSSLSPSRPRDNAPHRARSRYDAAQTSDENRKHWAAVDSFAAVSQLTPEVRRTLRNRARYECQNNSFAAGLIRTLVNDTVGTGPRLQLLTDNDELNAAVEVLWSQWAAATDWALTCRVLSGVRYVTGECFAVLRENKRLDQMGFPVNLDLRLYEPDQIAHPWGYANYDNPHGDDGIVCDADGDPVTYKVLRVHPGDNRALTPGRWEADDIAAKNVLHWFQPDRPGQLRGVTPLAPSLGIFAQLRRFTSATLTAAETAAMIAGVLSSNFPTAEDAAFVRKEDQFDAIDLVRGTLLTLPPNVQATQFKPEQPTTNYEMFVSAKLRECGRCLNVPFGKMAGDHSRYNYSSGRLDDAPYWHDREIERASLEAKVLRPFMYRWLDFAKFVIPSLAAFSGQWWELRHAWQYDARPTSDPVKDASGDEINLTNGSDTLTNIAARDGTTVEQLVMQRRREVELFRAAGLPLPPWANATAPAPVRTSNEPPPLNQEGDGAKGDTRGGHRSRPESEAARAAR